MAKRVTMNDIRKAEEGDSDKDQRYGVGGSSKGGGSDQQVLGWGKDQWDAAQRDGVSAEEFGPHGDEYRFKVTFWRNGFSVNDGPLRTGETPEDQAFIHTIHEQRQVPAELLAEAGTKDAVLDLVNKPGQDWEPPPKPKFAAFGGAGQSLGNSTAAPVIDHSAPVVVSDFRLEVDESEKTTKLQLLFHDGSKIVQKFNLTHTVQHIRMFMESQKPLPAGTSFALMTTYPPATLDDHSVTIQDGGLKGQAITQKLC
eukprot:TRINITY_DN7306_c0_g1_i2.p1 TRINITY_DN7306_c0_g1~~TRINITY_DN7306_c0_g1_i2.p1  ORF type:complete len:255 (+),score=62.57 TRINITY_DN7306_c0_g1_i2:198-962(+)